MTCGVLTLADVTILSWLPHSVCGHLTIISFWVLAGVLFGLKVLFFMGSEKALQWYSGYTLEWMLSLDNLFIFHLVFRTYGTPPPQMHKALFVGILGAVVMRLLMFMVGYTLLDAFSWVRWPFGALLIWNGVQAMREGDEDRDDDVRQTYLARGVQACLGSRLFQGYDEERGAVFIRSADGRLQVTLLFVVVVVVEFADVVFALDSVSAKVAQISDQYISFSSSVLAMFGLRSMFFVIQDLVEMFDLLNYGLGLILVFIGLELMLSNHVEVNTAHSCLFILSVIVASVVLSVVWSRVRTDNEDPKDEQPKLNNTRSLTLVRPFGKIPWRRHNSATW